MSHACIFPGTTTSSKTSAAANAEYRTQEDHCSSVAAAMSLRQVTEEMMCQLLH